MALPPAVEPEVEVGEENPSEVSSMRDEELNTGHDRQRIASANRGGDVLRREQSPGRAGDWPPFPGSPGITLHPQADYPGVPGTIGEIVEAASRESGCSRPIAALGVFCSLSALAAGDWNVRTLAPSVKPLSLNVIGMSESTWRKSTALEIIWGPHLEADRDAEAAWEEALELFAEMLWHEASTALEPRAASPRLIRGGISTEEMRKCLLLGRPVQAQFCDGVAELARTALHGARLASSLVLSIPMPAFRAVQG